MAALPLEYPRGAVKFDSVRCKKADLNSQALTFDHTTATHIIVTLPANAELVKLKYNFSETFNGALKLGNATDDDAYIEDASFPKSGAGVILLNMLLTAEKAIKLKVSGCTTGEGMIKLLWEV
jgi:hypothetical protein